MLKITELTEERFRTRHIKDKTGKRHRFREPYQGIREVKCIDGGRRFGHYIVDSIIFRIILAGLEVLLVELILNSDLDYDVAEILMILFSLFGFLFFYFICEYLWQKTPGKFLTKCIVIDEYGNKPSVKQLLLRCIIRWVPFEPFSCLGTPSRGWHDKWSKTFVVPMSEYETLQRLLIDQEEGARDIDALILD